MSPVVQTKSLAHLLPISFLISDWGNKMSIHSSSFFIYFFFFGGFPYHQRAVKRNLPLPISGGTDVLYQYLVMNVCPIYWQYRYLEDSDRIFTDSNTDRVNSP